MKNEEWVAGMIGHEAPDQEPEARLEPESVAIAVGTERWLTAWRLRNRGVRPLLVTGAWLPHGRFRGERRGFEPPLSLGPGETGRLEFVVACQEAPGTVVENAFVILSVLWRNRPWRVFVRLTVTFGEAAVPQPKVELVTYHPVGFAGS